MPVAETASTFNEVLVVSTAIAESTDREEKLALIESQLQDATQIIVDIYSRYTFEASVFENRPSEFMSADRFSELMLAAQEKAYGDGLDKDLRHPYMWVCKGHYYSGGLSFYNFPYAFGGLFARGLYAKYLAEGKPFVDTYKKLLRATGTSTVENAAKIAGVDLTEKSFWEAGLQSLADQIDEFCTLVDYKE
jgi:oligoendopeptidase F